MTCDGCRQIMSSFDFHEVDSGNQKLALYFLVKILHDGFLSFKDGTYQVNGVPFVDRSNGIDQRGGLWCAPGKGSHSYITRDGYAYMKRSAGVRNAAVFLLFRFIANIPEASRGEFHVGIRIRNFLLRSIFIKPENYISFCLNVFFN